MLLRRESIAFDRRNASLVRINDCILSFSFSVCSSFSSLLLLLLLLAAHFVVVVVVVVCYYFVPHSIPHDKKLICCYNQYRKIKFLLSQSRE